MTKRIRVRTIDGMRGFVNEFWVKDRKKIEFWEALSEHNPNYVKIIKVIL
jgi:hypothetical protein